MLIACDPWEELGAVETETRQGRSGNRAIIWCNDNRLIMTVEFSYITALPRKKTEGVFRKVLECDLLAGIFE